jgi:hypothetical protein
VSRRHVEDGREYPQSAEVSRIPRQVDLRVHDRVALDEIELYAEVLSAVAATDRPLTPSELDAVLGLRPAVCSRTSLTSAALRSIAPSGAVPVRYARWYMTSVLQRRNPSDWYMRIAGAFVSST